MDLVEETLQDIIPPREIPRRRLIHSGIAQQKFRRAVLEASAEIASEFTEHYWKEVVNGGKSGQGHAQPGADQPPPPLPPPTSNQSLKQRFVYYLNASGRYLVLREHLRQAVSQIVQQRCLNLRPSGFQSHRDFQTLLHDMYNYLVDEMHESLNRTKLIEGDPLDPQPPKIICDPDAESPSSMKEIGTRTLLRELLFYSEESFVQGDFDNCHRIHLQRICRSREDAGCWLDFALMWLSRGDDRMAEIAVREALRRDPTSIYALVIGGIIAIRHNDSRGVSVLGAALDMKPLSPELCVILALAHIGIGAEDEGDYFFRKAAYLHRTLTGQSTEDLDEKLTKLKNSAGLSNLSKMEAERIAAQQEVEAELAEEEMEEVPLEESPPIEMADQGTTTRKNKKTKQSKKRKSKTTGSIDSVAAVEETPVDKKAAKKEAKRDSINETGDAKGPARSKKQSLDKNDNAVQDLANVEAEEEDQEEEEMVEDEFYTRKMSLSRETEQEKHTQTQEPLPKVDFVPALSDLIVEDSILPPLRPSLLIPWNVTDASDKAKTVVDIPSEPQNEDASNEIEEMMEEEEEVVDIEEAPTPRRPSKDAATGTRSKKGAKGKRKSMDKEITPTERMKEVTTNTDETLEADANNDIAPEMEIEELFLSPEAMPDVEVLDSNNGDKGSLPVFVNRVGSELIWAGQLLLKLRMFDMLDGVLTRELYSSGQRSMQFLYLRAMSLYIRRCQREALPVIEEALQLDPDNSVLWILRGHCFYEIGEPDEAAKNYETALRIPVGKENRHLLYLRFGSLALDAGNYDTAKRVFLYGIQKYPTPYLWLAIGNTCYTMGNFEEAEAAFAEANRLDNTNPITWAHLALINLACDRQNLAEQSYKWAMRFGLKKGKILDEIKKLQVEKGFGDPSFPRIPNCIPHDYYVRRLGRQNPFDIYKDALLHETPNMGKKRFDNTERENMLRDKLQGKTPSQELLSRDEQPVEFPLTPEAELVDVATDPYSGTEPIDLEPVTESPELIEEVPSSPVKKDKKKSKRTKSKNKKVGGGAARESNAGRPTNPAEGEFRRRKSSKSRERSSINPRKF